MAINSLYKDSTSILLNPLTTAPDRKDQKGIEETTMQLKSNLPIAILRFLCCYNILLWLFGRCCFYFPLFRSDTYQYASNV